MKKLIFLLNICILSCLAKELDACTTFIISGRYTPDGKPVLYKHRDTGNLNNALAIFTDGKYTYVGLLNADSNWNNELWGGYNSAGFAIMNSVAYNLNIGDTTKYGDQEGKIMKMALQQCTTIADFEKLLNELPKPLGVDTNFGVIDAFGGAAYFETGHYSFNKIDANDPVAAPYGYLIRTNHSFTGPIDQGHGYIRYATASEALYMAAAMKRYEPRYLISKTSRSLYHSLTKTNLWDDMPRDNRSEKFVNFEDFIPRNSSASAICITGTKKGEDPSGTVMWTLLGFPLTTVAIPVWITEDKKLPLVLSMKDGLHAPLCDAALALREKCFPVKRGSGPKYLNLAELINEEKTGIMQLLEPVENEIFNRANTLILSAAGNKPKENRILDFYKWIDEYLTVSYEALFGIEMNLRTP